MKYATMITGVAGTTGSHILKQLLTDPEVISGNRYIIGIDDLSRKGSGVNIRPYLSSDNFLFIREDFREWVRKCRLVDQGQIDEIYHMAAVVPTHYFYDSPDLTYEVNCQGTIDLFNWSLRNHVKRFVVGSSSEIYGHIRSEDLPAKETTPSNFDSEEVTTRWSYAEGKLLTEHYLNHYKGQMERVCHLRFTNTYGVEDLEENHVIPYLIRSVLNNSPEIHINKYPTVYRRAFLNNADSAAACIAVMKKGRNGSPYNVGSSTEVSIEQLLNIVLSLSKEITGKDYEGEIYRDIVRPGDPLRCVLSCERLKEDTGFIPQVTLSQGIREMIVKYLESKEDHHEKNN